jgi:acyl carrier protein
MTSDVKTRITAYLSRFFPVRELSDDDDIFALGFVNSMFAMQLVAFVEHDFAITVENEDLELDNFRTVNALTAFVTGKLVPAAAR